MPIVEVVDQKRKKVGTLELLDGVFAVPVRHALVLQVLKGQLAGRRSGNASTKTKGEVRGGGRKPYKQKGTGNARRGSQRSPLIVGGGQTFGPKPRSYDQATPKGMIRGAIRSVLSDRLKSDRMLVVQSMDLAEAKTKKAVDLFKNGLKIENALVIDESNTSLERAARNIPHIRVIRAKQINVYELLKHEWLIMSQASAKNLSDQLGKTVRKSV